MTFFYPPLQKGTLSKSPTFPKAPPLQKVHLLFKFKSKNLKGHNNCFKYFLIEHLVKQFFPLLFTYNFYNKRFIIFSEMRTTFLLLFISTIFFPYTSNANNPKLTLESYNLIQTISIQTIDSIRKSRKVPKSLLPVRYAVKVYEILYNSKHIDGSNIIASGLYFMPVNPENDVPLLSYHPFRS